ncbi:hypothetical protein NN561_000531 [Cricetulus griseus]
MQEGPATAGMSGGRHGHKPRTLAPPPCTLTSSRLGHICQASLDPRGRTARRASLKWPRGPPLPARPRGLVPARTRALGSACLPPRRAAPRPPCVPEIRNRSIKFLGRRPRRPRVPRRSGDGGIDPRPEPGLGPRRPADRARSRRPMGARTPRLPSNSLEEGRGRRGCLARSMRSMRGGAGGSSAPAGHRSRAPPQDNDPSVDAGRASPSAAPEDASSSTAAPAGGRPSQRTTKGRSLSSSAHVALQGLRELERELHSGTLASRPLCSHQLPASPC